MNDAEWIRRALDGELDARARSELEARCAARPALAEALRRQQQLVAQLGTLRSRADSERAETTERIMAQLHARQARLPRAGRLRPAAALAAGLALLAIGLAAGYLLGSRSGDRPAYRPGSSRLESDPLSAARMRPTYPPPGSARPGGCSTDVVLVRFSIQAKQARSVALVGDFNGWRQDRTLLRNPNGDGVWQISLPLRRGSYQYAFVIDGKRWVPDPKASLRPDGFGGTNSVISL